MYFASQAFPPSVCPFKSVSSKYDINDCDCRLIKDCDRLKTIYKEMIGHHIPSSLKYVMQLSVSYFCFQLS